MPIKVECQSCGHRYQVGDNMAGKKVKCKTCSAVIAIPSGGDDEFDFGAIDVDAPSQETAAPSPHLSRAGAKVAKPAPPPRFEDDDDDRRDGDEPAVPESNAAFAFAGSKALEGILPIVLAAGGLGWMALQALHAEDAAHGWVGPFRAAIYIVLYAAIAYPFALMGVRAAGQKAYFPMPDSYHWKTFATFCLPAALAAIFTLIIPSIPMFIVGLLLGMVVAIGAFIFLFNLGSHQMGTAIGVVSGYVVGGVVLAAAVLFGLNFLVMAALTFNKSAHEYAVSPLGPQFSWNAPAAPEEPVKKKKAGDSLALNEGTTQPATTEPATQPIVVATQPSEIVKTATTQLATAVNPSTQPAATQAVETTQPVTVVPQPSNSPLLTAAPSPLAVGPVEDAYFSPQIGGSAVLALKMRGELGDSFEFWNTNAGGEWTKVESFSAQPKTNDHGGLVLNAKGTAMARIIDFPRPTIEIRPLTGDPAGDQNKIKRVDPDAVRASSLSLIGFANNGQILSLTCGQEGMLDIDDPLKTSQGPGTQRSRAVSMYGLPANAHCNVAVTPDSRFMASVRHGAPVAIPNAVMGNYLAINGIAGTNTYEKFSLTNLPADHAVPVTGLSISPDGTKVALLYQNNADGLIEIYKLPDGKQLGSHIFGKPAAAAITDFHGSALTWLADGTALLINGRYVMNADDFSDLGDLGIENVKAQHVVDRGTILLLEKDPADGGKGRILVAKLDTTKFHTAATKPAAGHAAALDPHSVTAGH